MGFEATNLCSLDSVLYQLSYCMRQLGCLGQILHSYLKPRQSYTLTHAGDLRCMYLYMCNIHVHVCVCITHHDVLFSFVYRKYVSTFIHFPKPLIVGVNGPAVGISVTVLALCDLVYAADNVSRLLGVMNAMLLYMLQDSKCNTTCLGRFRNLAASGIRESVDSLCRDGADMPRPPYIGKACTCLKATFVSLFRHLTVVLKCFCT